jgi:O-antigen ligase
MTRLSANTLRPAAAAAKDGSGSPLGFLYVLGVPLSAGISTLIPIGLEGFNYTGFLWLFFLVAGVVLLVAEKAWVEKIPRAFPLTFWLVWFGYLWLSLSWCEELELRNIQDAVQISMPLLVGLVCSVFVRSEDQLERLLRTFGFVVVLLGLCVAAEQVGLLNALKLQLVPRPLGLTAALAGGVFLAWCPAQFFWPLLGWALCILLTFVTGSRTATLVLVILPVLHPLYRTRVLQGLVILTLTGLGIGLFYTPIFQKRFFHEGSGTLTDVFNGDFLSFGRFEYWPDIWEEAWRHPFLGAGVGTAYNFVPTVWEDMHHVHNDYLRVGFELGLVGLTLFLGVFLWQLWQIRAQIQRSQGVVRTAFAAAWLGFLVLMITSFTDNTLSYNLWYMNPLFAILGGAYGVAGRGGRESRSDQEKTPCKDQLNRSRSGSDGWVALVTDAPGSDKALT